MNRVLMTTSLFALSTMFGACIDGEEMLDDLEVDEVDQATTVVHGPCNITADLGPETNAQRYTWTLNHIESNNCSNVKVTTYTGNRPWYGDVRWYGENLPPDGHCTGAFQVASLYRWDNAQWKLVDYDISQGKVIRIGTADVCFVPGVRWPLDAQRSYRIEAVHTLDGDRRGTRIEFVPR